MNVIYTISNKSTGRFYLGSTKSLNNRYGDNPDWSKHHNKYLAEDANKYGNDDFICDIIEELSDNIQEKELREIEQYYLDVFRLELDLWNMMYNISYSATNIGSSLYGKDNGMYGKKHKLDARKKISDTSKKRWESDEYRKIMLVSATGESNPMYGTSAYKLWVERYGEEEANKRKREVSEKLSRARIGIPYKHKGKTIFEIYLETCDNDVERAQQKVKDVIKKHSIRNNGANNPMYGKPVYDVWVEKYGREKADAHESQRRKKLSEAHSGAKSFRAKLTNEQVIEIRCLAKQEPYITMKKIERDKILAKKYNVCPSTICNVIVWRTYNK